MDGSKEAICRGTKENTFLSLCKREREGGCTERALYLWLSSAFLVSCLLSPEEKLRLEYPL